MGDQNLRVWPVDGDSYGAVTEYPRYAKHRMEPHYPGAAGNENTDLVVYAKDATAENGEQELGRHTVSEVLIAFAGQSTPPVVLDSEHERRTTVSTDKPKTKAGTAPDKK